MKTVAQRWMAPTTIGIGGTIVAGAVAVGHGWSNALIAEVITALLSGMYYVLTRSSSDVGAVYARRADERQRLVYLRASALALKLMLITAFVCAVVTVAMNDNYWQADVIGSVGGVAFVVGLASFGSNDEQRSGEDGTVEAKQLRSGRGVME